MRILGIDPGSGSTGYGIIETDGSQHTASSVRRYKNTIPPAFSRTPSQDPYGSERYSLRARRRTSWRSKKCFTPPMCSRLSGLGHARGIALLVAAQQGLCVYSNILRWKSKAPSSDTGGRKKRRSRPWSVFSSTSPEIPTPDDAADALAVAICHANRMTNYELRITN